MGKHGLQWWRIVNLVEAFADVKGASSQFNQSREGDDQCQQQAMLSINI
jgi:hypothetical protein